MWTTGAANPMGIIGSLSFLTRIASTSTLRMLDNKVLLKQLKSEQFDLGITELFDFAGLGNIPLIEI
ncbi:unnamed protein product [Strongylus vulgaris]|uniref:Uncharacterized protein n=1 Tax=Strongylus vulgaris TaxID=40348 RepID=A0A3P7K9B2_STRVU|nr:unnamed protein product [Strongylus vulgaris]